MSANLENSAVATGLEKVSFSFQFQRRAMPKNVQTTIQLHSFHMLVRLCSKYFKLDFSSMGTKNIQMCKVSLENTEEPEIKLPKFVGSWRKQKKSRKTSTLLHWLHESLDCVDHNNLWKILKEMEISDHLTCLLRNLYAGQEATVKTRYGTMNGLKTGKGVWQGCIMSPCLFNLCAEYFTWNTRMDESQARIKISGRNSNNVIYADDTTLMAEVEEELKSLLMRVKEESENAGLKLNIQKQKIMASGPITSWQTDWGGKWKQREALFSGTPKSL